MYILVWIVFVLIVVAFGSIVRTRLGGWQLFFISLFLSPIVGFIAAAVTANQAKEIAASDEEKAIEALKKKKEMRDLELITAEEYEAAKNEVLNPIPKMQQPTSFVNSNETKVEQFLASSNGMALIFMLLVVLVVGIFVFVNMQSNSPGWHGK